MKIAQKKILWISFVVLFLLVLVNHLGNSQICNVLRLEHYSCINLFYVIEILFLPMFPVFFFSLVTYYLREEVFRFWFNFSKWWILLSAAAVLLTTESGGGIGIGMSWGKGETAVVFALLYVLVSVLLILYKSLKLRKK